MEFLVLLSERDHFARWGAYSEEQLSEAREAFGAFAKAVQERGEIVAGDALQPPGASRTVEPGAARTVTDGPFTETVEQLAGYYVIDVADIDTAADLARLLPDVMTVEVRPTRGMQIR